MTDNERKLEKLSQLDGEDFKDAIGESVEAMSIVFDTVLGTPLSSVAKSFIKSANSFSNYLFARRLVIFLHNVNALKISERRVLSQMLNKEKGLKAGETLLELIEKMDDDRKAILLAELAKGIVRDKEMTLDIFYRFGHIIKNSFYPDLEKLKDFITQGYVRGTSESLNNMGLLYIKDVEAHNMENMDRYDITELGILLNKYISKVSNQ